MSTDTETTRARAWRMRLEGHSLREIGDACGVSAQRVMAIVGTPKATRAIVRLQHRGRCATCGVAVGRRGNVHHRYVIGMTPEDYNALANLVLLCRSCHRRTHLGLDGPAPVRPSPATELPNTEPIAEGPEFCPEHPTVELRCPACSGGTGGRSRSPAKRRAAGANIRKVRTILGRKPE